MDPLLYAGAISAAFLSIVGLIGLTWKFYRFLDRLSVLVNHELRHNGGSSMKDHAKQAAETKPIVEELKALVEDRFSALDQRIDILEEKTHDHQATA